MKRTISVMLAVLCLISCFAGCSNVKTSKSFTFNVETGDKISIELDTTDGYDLSSNVPFEVSSDRKTLSQGIFIEASQYEEYVSVVNSDENATVIDSGTKDFNKYIFWSYDGSEYNVAVSIGNSNTGIILGNAVSEESAKECFDRLTFSVEK